MQAKILVSLNPFPVPEYVTLAPKPKAPSQPPAPVIYYPIALEDLDGETLHRLCEEFRDTVFFRAGKPQPPDAMPVAPDPVDFTPGIQALGTLRAILCDPEGVPYLPGADADREELADALDKLARFVS